MIHNKHHYQKKKQKQNLSGFTLLELLICLVIMGILLKVGIGSLQSSSSPIQKTISMIMEIVVQAKTESIFLSDKTELIFSKDKIRILHQGVTIETKLLPDISPIKVINTKALFNNNYTLRINKLGIIEESLILLDDGDTKKSLYIPSVGRIVILDYHTTIDHIYKAIL